MKPHHVAVTIAFMLCTGLVLIAHGSGVLTGKWSVGMVITGAAISYVALRLMEHAR